MTEGVNGALSERREPACGTSPAPSAS